MSTPPVPPSFPPPVPPTIPPPFQGGAAAMPQQASKATMAVVMGVLGIICCGFLAPVAWYSTWATRN